MTWNASLPELVLQILNLSNPKFLKNKSDLSVYLLSYIDSFLWKTLTNTMFFMISNVYFLAGHDENSGISRASS